MSFFFEDSAVEPAEKELRIFNTLGCAVCPLDKIPLSSPKLSPSGTKKPVIYILSSTPNASDDQLGKHLTGDSYDLLQKFIPPEWDSTIRIGSIVRCCADTSKNIRNVTDVTMECCRSLAERDIEETKPFLIIGLGSSVLDWVLGTKEIQTWRGRYFPIKIGSHSCWFFSTHHPESVLRNEKNELELDAFKRDLKKIFTVLETDTLDEVFIPTKDEIFDELTLVDTYTDESVEYIETILRKWCRNGQKIGIDYETNGLRPYAVGKILTVAFSNGVETLAFPYQHRDARWERSQFDRLTALLKWFWFEADCVRIAFNLSFELEWSYYFFGTPPLAAQIYGDAMVQAYCLDERRGGLSLNTTTFVLFGFHIKKFSSINVENLDNEPVLSVLRYNSLDAKWTLKAYEKLEIRIEQDELEFTYKMQINRIPTMVLTQLAGIDVDQVCVKRYWEEQQKKLDVILENILALDICKQFEKQVGNVVNPGSTLDLVTIFRDLLGRTEGIKGKKYSTDESVLKRIDHPLSTLVLEYRTAQKLQSMYFEGLAVGGKSLQADNRIHTQLNTMFTVTGRLSSDSPNIQNFPKREDSWVRNIIIPSQNHSFVSADYGQIEVRVIAMASKDEVLIKMLWERYDMHLAWAEKFAKVFPNLLSSAGSMKELRSIAKNKIVFPAFYGSKTSSIANDLGVNLSKCETLMEEFWELFAGVRKWQEGLFLSYQQLGYVECLTGRRRRYPLEVNKIINTPIQGTASDMVVDAMVRLSTYAQATGKQQYQARFNIHDDLTFSVPNVSLEKDLEAIISFMLQSSYNFVNVPLSVEVGVGDNWANIKSIGDFFSNEW